MAAGTTEQAALDSLVEQVKQATADGSPLRLQGSGSKGFYGRQIASDIANNSRLLDFSGYRGVVSYEPTELYITARAGTRLSELEATLAEHHQMLGFEPPHFGPNATLGGAVASGLSGPIRPYAGSARDFVLGSKVLNGNGEVLSFGGQVMKNVAGYDLSRLLTGSLGTLGGILEVSLKVLPRPARTVTLVQQSDERGALQRLTAWALKPYPVSATAFYQGQLYIRLSGAASAVEAATQAIGGDRTDDDNFWSSLREQTHAFFDLSGQADGTALWRFSIPPATGPLALGQHTLIEWGGAQRWLISDLTPDALFAAAAAVGGHATLWAGGGSASRSGQVFQALDPVLLRLHQRLKQSFDPAGVFNPGRLYAEL